MTNSSRYTAVNMSRDAKADLERLQVVLSAQVGRRLSFGETIIVAARLLAPPADAEPNGRRLRGPAHAHLDAPCTDACYEPEPDLVQVAAARGFDLRRVDQPMSIEVYPAGTHLMTMNFADEATARRWLAGRPPVADDPCSGGRCVDPAAHAEGAHDV